MRILQAVALRVLAILAVFAILMVIVTTGCAALALLTGDFLPHGMWLAVILLSGPCAVIAIVQTGDISLPDCDGEPK